MKSWLNKLLSTVLFDSSASYGNLSITQEAILIVAKYYQDQQPLVIVKENSTQAHALCEMMCSLAPQLKILCCEHEESFRLEAIASSPETFQNRLYGLYHLLNEKVDVLITSAYSIMRKMPSPQLIKELQKVITVNGQVNLNELEQYLISVGYRKTTMVQAPLTYAKRGGLLDVFSIQYEHPVRIELFDDIVDDIRFFDVHTQQTINRTDSVTLFVANDMVLCPQQKQQLIDKIEDNLSKYDDNPSLVEKIRLDIDQFINGFYDSSFYRYYGLVDSHTNLLDYFDTALIINSPIEMVKRSQDYFVSETVDYLIEEHQQNHWINCYDVLISSKPKRKILDFYQFHSSQSNFEIHQIQNPHLELSDHLPLISKLALHKKVVLAVTEHEIDRLIDELVKQDLPYSMIVSDTLVSGINVVVDSLIHGFTINETSVFTSFELFDVVIKSGRFEGQFQKSITLHGIAELEVGDYVVHKNYGVGKYLGLVTKEINQFHKDFLNIEYANKDTLLVPLEQFKLVRKYVSSESVAVKLNKLGNNSWQKTKEKIANSVNNIADELIDLYQKRKQQKGFKFSEDSPLQKQFEKEFPYELTHDQVVAIKEVKADMESDIPMDRLLCGDVGFGKTEVAIRAAFKAVVDNKQVAFLCPTTVLSQQHYRTFVKRFKNYPVRIELLNRFVEPSKQKQIIQDLKSGKIDVLIGTHRILSQDINYQDLGLLVIDEEQRFGVAQKEKIKKLKTNIDVLSLSATPIPRTLQMSLIGIRSLSQLNTPPSMRMPVMTHVVEKSEKLVIDIVEREMARNGQVFYLYNNTTDIFNVAYRLQQHFKNVRVGVAHGKMSREEIEDVMIAFNNNDIQILVCTTIVETGIDIPNANTMIIENADRFGLAQLYQIKGRVGRSDRLAYAYLLIEPQKEISEVASKRLNAIKEFTQLGSGYKIAMRDLTIRGAGEILGGNQSGFIDSVGIDLYIELLQEALAIKQNRVVKKDENIKLNLQLDSYIPNQYLQNDALKIDLYQQIDEIASLSQLVEFIKTVKDRYGKMDNSMRLLLEKKQLELFLESDRIDDFKDRPKFYQIDFTAAFTNQIDGVKLFTLVNEVNSEIKLKYIGGKIQMMTPKSKNAISEMVQIVERLSEV